MGRYSKEYRETVLARIRNDKAFAKALYEQALEALLAGEHAEGLSMLRDMVHAEITFKELARQTGLNEKTLHRTLSRRGSPTVRTVAKIIAAIKEDLNFVPHVRVATA
jgi:DNA-binding phage protein